jgi:Mrp family chromosome partitioning ATPase
VQLRNAQEAHTNMNSGWVEATIRAVENVVIASSETGVRVVGLAAPDAGAGVTTLAGTMATVYARSGFRTLLIDLQSTVSHFDNTWLPGKNDAREFIVPGADEVDRLYGRPERRSQPLFNNVAALREAFSGQLQGYSKIVVDLPPLMENRAGGINAVAVAAACDSVLIVCAKGVVTTQRLRAMVGLVRSAGGQIGGSIMNEVRYPAPGAEIAAMAARALSFTPRFSQWIQRRAIASELLN